MTKKMILCCAFLASIASVSVASPASNISSQGLTENSDVQIANDKFISVKKARYHKTIQKNEVFNDYLYCSTIFNIKWPKELAGVSDMKVIQQGLIRFCLNKDAVGTDLNAEINKYISKPFFIDEYGEMDYKEITKSELDKHNPSFNQGYNEHNVILKMDSPSLMAFEHTQNTYMGGAHGIYGSTYLIFDRKTNTFFDQNNTFVNAKSAELLKIINTYIEKHKEAEYPAENVPETFYPSNQGVVFVFQPCEISCYSAGIIGITVPYSVLNAQLTPAFKKAIQDADTFKVFPSYQ